VAILAGFGYATVGVGLLALAAHQHGAARYAIGTVGVVVAAAGGWCLGYWLILGAFWGFAGNLYGNPSPAQWFMWALGAIALGTAAGLPTYGVGPSALVPIPIFFVVIQLAVIRPASMSPAYKRRLTAWWAIVCLAAIGAGLTIFLG